MNQKTTKTFAYPELYQRIIGMAAMFEGDFSIDWIQELAQSKVSHTFLVMEEAIGQGLLTKTGSVTFRFIDRENQADYRSTFRPSKKTRLHKKIADIIMQEDADDGTRALDMAPHLLQIQNDVSGCQWLLRAGKAYRNANQYQTAVKCYEKILKDLAQRHDSMADKLFIETAIGYSKISEVAPNTKAIIAVLEKSLKRARDARNISQEALIEMHLAKNQWYDSDFDQALKQFNHAWSLVNKADDPHLKQTAAYFSTFFLFWQGRLKDTIQNYEATAPVVEQYPRSRFMLLTGWVIGSAYCASGQVTQGMGMLDTIYALSQKEKDYYVTCAVSFGIGSVLLSINRTEEGEKYLNEALEMGTKMTNHIIVAYSLLILADLHYFRGEIAACEKKLDRFFRNYKDLHLIGDMVPSLLSLSWAAENGQIKYSFNLSLEKLIKRVQAGKNLMMKGVAHRYQALLQKKTGAAHPKIVKTLSVSLSFLEESGYQMEIARTRVELAREYLLHENEGAARQAMAPMEALRDHYSRDMIPGDIRFLLKDFRQDRNLLNEIMGLSQEFASIRDNRELLKKIISTANHITGAERGAIFLKAPDDATQPFTLRAAKNISADDIADPSFKKSMKTIGITAETGTGQLQTFSPDGPSGAQPDKIIRSFICVPMKFRGAVSGVLYHDNRRFSSTFRKADLSILDYFASQAAIAMDNAAAYEEIQSLLQNTRQEKEYYEEQHIQTLNFEEFVGESRAIKGVLAHVEQVAGTDATVLVLGETGVGKELVARAIHRHSSRKEKPFIRVNCSALPESLIASELFGHEKGAFTGADRRRVGRFELANTGTLFLDEIGDIPLEVQVRLLRVLQSGEFERVGGKETLRSDFRLIAATNKDLNKAVKNGNFREDLFYRLNVFPIQVPPLRERKDDISLLANYFLELFSSKSGKDLLTISQADISRLSAYDWPGNVRELENVIERGTILATGSVFKMPELNDAGPDCTIPIGGAVTLKEMERRHILWALGETRGKIGGQAGAAELLDIHPNTLHSRMKKLGIGKQPGSPYQ